MIFVYCGLINKDMDLKKHITDNYGTQYKFCESKGLKPSLVSYWCGREWSDMQKRTRLKICDILKIDKKNATV